MIFGHRFVREMASNQNPSLLQCSGCHAWLNLDSKTLPCFHSFCRTCLDRHFEGQTNSQCPECQEPLTLDQLSLAPFLVKSFRRLQLESTDWKCNWCVEDGIESIAKNCCYDCQKLFCNICCRYHIKLRLQHNIRDLDEMEREEVIKIMVTDNCTMHHKSKTSYCEGCNVCLCDTCYENHSADSPGCSSRPLSVRGEALKQKSQGPTLAKEMDDLGISLRRLNEMMRNQTDELNADCDSKCYQLWKDFEEMMVNAKRKTDELCQEMRQITADQVKSWRHLIEENEKTLKQLEIWRLHLQHFLSESQHDVDVVCGLRSLGSKLSSRLQKQARPEEKCQLGVMFPDWWLKVLEQLKTEMIGSVYLTRRERLSAAKNILIDKEWNLRGSDLYIRSIHVSKEDDHVFICCQGNNTIMEFTERGDIFDECILKDGTMRYIPCSMCSISQDMFLVVAVVDDPYQNESGKLIFLERSKLSPYLKIKHIIDAEEEFYSMCQINETIFVCDLYLQVDSITKAGRKIKTIITGKSSGYCPLIRADPSTGNLLVTRLDSSELFYFNPKGEKLRSVEIEEIITDFYVDEIGILYFCNKEGIFSLSPTKVLYKFEKRSEYPPRMFISKNKIFVYLQIHGNDLIKIFKMFH